MGSCRWGHDAQLQWKRTSRIPWIQCFGTRRFEKQRKRETVFAFLWWRHHRRVGSLHNHFRQSAQYLRSSSGHLRWIGMQNLWFVRRYRETCCSEPFRDHGDANRIVDNEQNASDQGQSARKLAARLRKIANLPGHLQLIKLCSNVGITKTVAKGQHFTTLDDAELDKLEGSCRSIFYLETTEPPKWKDGSVGTRRSVQLWN